MDTGYLAEGETMDDDYDVGRNLLPEEVLGIIDQLLCLEVRICPPWPQDLRLRFNRWPGIWDTLCHKRYSQVFISIGF